jgi:two-component sensor histidine kinase
MTIVWLEWRSGPMTCVAKPDTPSIMLVEAFAIAAERPCDDAHRTLAMPAADMRCDVAEYIARVCSAMATARLAETGLRLKLEICNAVLPADRCWRLALIVSELVHNAARHGSPDSEIVVELSVDHGELFCRVANAGACPSAPSSGRGRRVVLALTKELGGRADWVFTPTGACVWVVVPLEGCPTLGFQ